MISGALVLAHRLRNYTSFSNNNNKVRRDQTALDLLIPCEQPICVALTLSPLYFVILLKPSLSQQHTPSACCKDNAVTIDGELVTRCNLTKVKISPKILLLSVLTKCC